MWVVSLVRRKHKSGRGDLVNPVCTNFTVLAEHLLSPHGLYNGLEKPHHQTNPKLTPRGGGVRGSHLRGAEGWRKGKAD